MNFLDWGVCLTAFACQIVLAIVVKYVLDNGFHFPLFCTALHMGMSFLMCVLYIDVGQMLPSFKVFGFKEQMTHIVPIALAQALSIGLANVSLLYLFPSFVAMINSIQPICTLLLSLMFASDTFNMFSYIAMIPIILGSVVLCAQEHTFNAIGFVCIMGACVLRALKQVLQARLLCGHNNVDALTLLYYVAPYAFVIFLIWSVVQEGVTEPTSAFFNLPLKVPSLVLLSALVAGMFNIFSFLGLARLNATLWSLLGQLVTPLIALTSWLVFANVTTVLQIAAFVLASAGVYIYNQYGRVPHVVADPRINEAACDHADAVPQYGTMGGATLGKGDADGVNANDFDIESEAVPLTTDTQLTTNTGHPIKVRAG